MVSKAVDVLFYLFYVLQFSPLTLERLALPVVLLQTL